MGLDLAEPYIYRLYGRDQVGGETDFGCTGSGLLFTSGRCIQFPAQSSRTK